MFHHYEINVLESLSKCPFIKKDTFYSVILTGCVFIEACDFVFKACLQHCVLNLNLWPYTGTIMAIFLVISELLQEHICVFFF